MQGVRLFAEPMYTLGEASISSSYALVGTILNPSQIYFVQNLTNAVITFSNDGVNALFQLPANSFVLLDAGSNKGNFQSLSFPEGTSLFAKGAPSSGSVNLTTWYMG